MPARFTTIFAALCLLVLSCAPALAADAPAAPEAAKKKVLLVNSYHEGYQWSDEETKGAKSVFDTHPEVDFRIHYMRTQQMKTDEERAAAAVEAKKLIEEWKPDVVITTDDVAAKFLVMPYYKDASLPIVFAGVNWDASAYGFPYSNVTGMLEVGGVDELLKLVLKLTNKPDAKIVTLISDTVSERKETEMVKKLFGIKFAEEVYVKDFEAWKKAFIDLQTKGDVLYVQNIHSIPGWNDEEAKKIIDEHTKIVSASINNPLLADYCVLVYAKIPAEQGEWAAHTALDILGGKKVSDIPVAKNVRGKIYVNAKLAAKAGVKIPTDILEAAEITQ